MNKIIITKFNGVIHENIICKKEKNIYENEYIIDLLNINNYNIDKNIITITNNFMKDLFIKYNFSKNTKKILHILNSNENIEILKLYNYIINNYDKIIEVFPQKRKKEIFNALETCKNIDEEIIIKIMVNQLFNIYIKTVFNNIQKDKLNEIYLMVIRNEDINNILNKIGIKKDNKYNYLFKKNIIKITYRTFEKKVPHLCWKYCKNIDNCDKMDDDLTESISKYKFITSGYQILKPIVEEKNIITYKIDKFYVTDCKNYKKTRTK